MQYVQAFEAGIFYVERQYSVHKDLDIFGKHVLVINLFLDVFHRIFKRFYFQGQGCKIIKLSIISDHSNDCQNPSPNFHCLSFWREILNKKPVYILVFTKSRVTLSFSLSFS